MERTLTETSHPARMSAAIDEGRRALSVLMVEDSPSDSRLLLESLRESIDARLVKVDVVRKLADARTALTRLHFDCVLVDLGLPDGRGTGNVEALATIDPQTALIVLTGLDSDASAQTALACGAQDYLVKSQHDPAQLLKRLRLAVQRHRQVRALEARSRSDFERASQDPLTGLPNRKLFEDRAAQALTQARLHATPLAIGFVDLDGFKTANDLYGHAYGDEVLRAVGLALAGTAHSTDTVARLGGDEFALLMIPGEGPFDPAAEAARFRQALRAIVDVGGRAFHVDCSIGVAQYPAHGDNVDELIRQSDRAMYGVKRDGGGVRVCGHAEVPPQPAPAPLTVGQTFGPEAPVELVYQPWVDASTGRYAGVEVLARWREGQRVLSAEEFMPEAERSGLIRDIGRAVMRKALHHWTQLRDEGIDPGLVALNVSAAELVDGSFVDDLLATLASTAVDPFRLRIEVRGATLAEPRTAASLDRLRQAGCRIVLDRFGEAGTDLATLALAPLDGIKLDRRLLRQLADEGLGGRTRRLVSAALGAAAGLNIPAIVAGVESAGDMRLLSLTGARFQQGNWHSRCVDAAALGTALRRGTAGSCATGVRP